MRTYLVITVTSPDKPGIVERLTSALVGCAVNWEESQMARLGGEFAGIVLISVPQTHRQAVIEKLHALNDEEMLVVVKPTLLSGGAPSGYDFYQLTLKGGDHEGIVHTVAAFLVDQQINVEKMETEIVRAPITAAPLFEMTAVIRVPAALQRDELQANLLSIGDHLGVDISIEPMEECS